MKKIISIIFIGLISLSTSSCTNNDNKNNGNQTVSQSGITNSQNDIIDTSGKTTVVIEDPTQAVGSVNIGDNDSFVEPTVVK